MPIRKLPAQAVRWIVWTLPNSVCWICWIRSTLFSLPDSKDRRFLLKTLMRMVTLGLWIRCSMSIMQMKRLMRWMIFFQRKQQWLMRDLKISWRVGRKVTKTPYLPFVWPAMNRIAWYMKLLLLKMEWLFSLRSIIRAGRPRVTDSRWTLPVLTISCVWWMFPQASIRLRCGLTRRACMLRKA